MKFIRKIGICLFVAVVPLTVSAESPGEIDFSNLDSPEHRYWERTLRDPFSRIIDDLENGALALDTQNEKSFLISLLQALDIPVSSQTLVFSTTSLQLSKISQRTPRALYFNEEVYLGYVPGGKIEIISMDPDLGGIFYIFEIPEPGQFPEVQRSRRCMNCHSDEDTRDIPGLVIKSVIPGPRGGSLESFRRHTTGHQIPLAERFGGWYVTGDEALEGHRGNSVGRFTPKGIELTPVEAGTKFDWSMFPAQISDLLAHLVHEHQAGFVNRILELHYRARTRMRQGQTPLGGRNESSWEKRVDDMVRYLLFADEAELPEGGIRGDDQFKSEFLAAATTTKGGVSLREFDLETRLFRYRCSYMIYSDLFKELPVGLKGQIIDRMERALSTEHFDPDYAYLSPDEKRSILKILGESHPDWMANQ